jgi:hypothetical protein
MEAPIDYEGPERMAGDVERKILRKRNTLSWIFLQFQIWIETLLS